ncbi:MAG: adenylate/guanylate cyclase domain-containing protein [Parcubacteria group bacterium]|jgi:class 3 adenylate cyclase
MGLKEEITEKVKGYMGSAYEITDGNVIPDKQSIGFGAKAKRLKHAIVMYADLRGSRGILSDNTKLLTCRAHKSFLYAAAKCIRNEDGHLRSFNGDSLLAFFIGEDAAKRAVRAAMKIKFAVVKIINPILEEKGKKKLNFGIGIGQGEIMVVKSGVPGEEMYQDLIWIGWATYHAFEYGDRARSPRNIWISKNVYKTIEDDKSLTQSNGKSIWVYNDDQEFSFGKVRVYKTSYHWNI